eukprot:c2663_g1_i1.p1 GENE.c2663_g1_i1~~c2663_g1_i1.p1  ORF type:complete len:304 (-),score=80.17 c2663_g1_i1:41-952(-)
MRVAWVLVALLASTEAIRVNSAITPPPTKLFSELLNHNAIRRLVNAQHTQTVAALSTFAQTPINATDTVVDPKATYATLPTEIRLWFLIPTFIYWFGLAGLLQRTGSVLENKEMKIIFVQSYSIILLVLFVTSLMVQAIPLTAGPGARLADLSVSAAVEHTIPFGIAWLLSLVVGFVPFIESTRKFVSRREIRITMPFIVGVAMSLLTIFNRTHFKSAHFIMVITVLSGISLYAAAVAVTAPTTRSYAFAIVTCFTGVVTVGLLLSKNQLGGILEWVTMALFASVVIGALPAGTLRVEEDVTV